MCGIGVVGMRCRKLFLGKLGKWVGKVMGLYGLV